MKKIFVIFALALVILLPQMALADTVTYLGPKYGFEWINFDYTYAPPSGAQAGEFKIELNGVETWAFCVDLENTIAYENQANGSTPVGVYAQAAYLADQFRLQADTKAESAALQTAIWEAVYGIDFTYKSGLSDPSYLATYSAALGNYDPNWNASGYLYLILSDAAGNPKQGLITSVPEPFTLLLIGIGLVGLAGVGRKLKH